MFELPHLTAHHVGCLTSDMKKSISQYRLMGFQNVSQIFSVSEQNVKVCFIEIKEGFFLELVEFSDDSLSLKKLFKTGNPYYHIGYLVKDIKKEIECMQSSGFHLISKFSSEAFNGKICAFLYSPEMHLIELIES